MKRGWSTGREGCGHRLRPVCPTRCPHRLRYADIAPHGRPAGPPDLPSWEVDGRPSPAERLCCQPGGHAGEVRAHPLSFAPPVIPFLMPPSPTACTPLFLRVQWHSHRHGEMLPAGVVWGHGEDLPPISPSLSWEALSTPIYIVTHS